MNDTTDHRLTEFGLNYNFEESNVYKLNVLTKFIPMFKKYYTWTKKCNNFYKIDINEEWSDVFTLLNPIVYQTTRRNIEKVRFYSEEGTEKPENTIARTGYIGQNFTVPTGYVIPKYNFLSYKLNASVSYYKPDSAVYTVNKEAYNNAIKLFSIEKNSKITPKQYTDIGNYRDLLHRQIERQANQSQNIDREIADILKIYYYESERAIVKAKMREQSKNKITIIELDWHSIKQGLSELYQVKIQGGMGLQDIKNENIQLLESTKKEYKKSVYKYHEFNPFRLDNDKYIPTEILKYILNGYQEYMKQKDILISTTLPLVKKIEPLESLLEDFFFDRSIKSVEEYTRSKKREESSYGYHSQNSGWINNTYKTQQDLLPNENQAVNETVRLYKKEFGFSIGPSTVRRLCDLVQ